MNWVATVRAAAATQSCHSFLMEYDVEIEFGLRWRGIVAPVMFQGPRINSTFYCSRGKSLVPDHVYHSMISSFAVLHLRERNGQVYSTSKVLPREVRANQGACDSSQTLLVTRHIFSVVAFQSLLDVFYDIPPRSLLPSSRRTCLPRSRNASAERCGARCPSQTSSSPRRPLFRRSNAERLRILRHCFSTIPSLSRRVSPGFLLCLFPSQLHLHQPGGSVDLGVRPGLPRQRVDKQRAMAQLMSVWEARASPLCYPWACR